MQTLEGRLGRRSHRYHSALGCPKKTGRNIPWWPLENRLSLGRITPDKRACIDWFGHFRAARRKILNPQDAASLAVVMGVHRRDDPLKFRLHNSRTVAPKPAQILGQSVTVTDQKTSLPWTDAGTSAEAEIFVAPA
jgi:hypothetical protein